MHAVPIHAMKAWAVQLESAAARVNLLLWQPFIHVLQQIEGQMLMYCDGAVVAVHSSPGRRLIWQAQGLTHAAKSGCGFVFQVHSAQLTKMADTCLSKTYMQ